MRTIAFISTESTSVWLSRSNKSGPACHYERVEIHKIEPRENGFDLNTKPFSFAHYPHPLNTAVRYPRKPVTPDNAKKNNRKREYLRNFRAFCEKTAPFLVAIYRRRILIAASGVVFSLPTLLNSSIQLSKGIYPMAKAAAASKEKPLTKTQLFANIAETTGSPRNKLLTSLNHSRKKSAKQSARRGQGCLPFPIFAKLSALTRKLFQSVKFETQPPVKCNGPNQSQLRKQFDAVL